MAKTTTTGTTRKQINVRYTDKMAEFIERFKKGECLSHMMLNVREYVLENYPSVDMDKLIELYKGSKLMRDKGRNDKGWAYDKALPITHKTTLSVSPSVYEWVQANKGKHTEGEVMLGCLFVLYAEDTKGSNKDFMKTFRNTISSSLEVSV